VQGKEDYKRDFKGREKELFGWRLRRAS